MLCMMRQPSLPRVVTVAILALLTSGSAMQSAAVTSNLYLDRNGSFASPQPGTWFSGNALANSTHWRAGESIPYRWVMLGLDTGPQHQATFQWQFLTSGLHALDYLTSFDRTDGSIDPCAGVSGCSGFTSFSIPLDPVISGSAVQPVAGDFRCYGCTIQAAIYSYLGSDADMVTVVFTAQSANAVLVWGQHIAHPQDWGYTTASSPQLVAHPFHVIGIDLDGTPLSLDRSVASDAVIGPPVITASISDTLVAVGAGVTDHAILPANASGAVRFFVCGPGSSAPDCRTGGVQVGSAQTIAGGSVPSDAFVPAAPGRYAFRVDYAPDSLAQFSYTGYGYADTTTESFKATGTTGVGGSPPQSVVFAQPNPARAAVTISCSNTGSDPAFAVILDVAGRVRRRLRLDPRASGVASGQWDLRDGLSLRVPAGIYMVRIEHASGPPVIGRIVVLR